MSLLSRIILVLFCLLLSLNSVLADELSTKKLKEISALIKKDYLFFSGDDEQFELLGGSWTKPVTKDDFFHQSYEEISTKIDKSKLFEQIRQAYKGNQKVYLRKDEKNYVVDENRFARVYPPEVLKEQEKLKKEKAVSSLLLEINQSRYGQFKISANYVTVNGVAQFSPELAWLPYFRFSKNAGMATVFSGSTYVTEDDNLQETISLGLRFQLLGRYYMNRFFVEAGGGLHYFVDYKDNSLAYTIGGGYVFKEPLWIISEDVFFSGIYFHVSKVDWRQEILESKLGIAISI